MFDPTAWLDKEVEILEKQLYSGLISQAEYNQSMKDLQADYRQAMREAAAEAYDRELERW